MVKIFCKLCKESVEMDTWDDHVALEKHIKNLPANIIVKSMLDKGKITDIHEYFSKFGKITKKGIISSEGNNIRIQYFFEDASAYSAIVQKPHTLFGQNLVIESIKSPTKPAISSDNETNLTNLRTIICESFLYKHTFTEQVAIMLEKLKINTPDKEKILDIIHKGITLILKPKFPACEVYFYGSKVTGLDLETSKLGVYVDNVKQSGTNENKILETIKDLILKSDHFDSVTLFKEKEFPVIKFRHVTTDTMCYLNVSNRLIAKRSELIKHYLSLDEKVHMFLVIVKFWGKSHEIFKGSLLNYGLHLLAIFYLQQEPYRLPSIVELQKTVSPQIENNWNCAFSLDKTSSLALQNATILELVTGFFKFYENFDFFSYVISPFCGYAIEKTRFLQPFQLPDCYNLYVTNQKALDLNSGIAVQDPFEHSKNIFHVTAITSGSRLASFCRNALTLVKSGESQLLSKLLQLNVPEDVKFFIEKPKGFKKDWKNSVKKLTRDILTGIFCCKIVKTESESDRVTYFFVGSNAVWMKRVKALKALEPDLIFCTEFEKEVAVTSRIVKGHNSKPTYNASVRLLFLPNKVEVFLSSPSKEKKTSNLNYFFRVKMEVFLKEMMNMEIEYSSADLAEFTALADTITAAPTLLKQITLLRKKWQLNGEQIEKEYKKIIDDLTRALSPQFSNEIHFCQLTKTTINFPNKIFNFYLNQSNNPESAILSTAKTLQKSEAFSMVSLFFGGGIVKFTHEETQSRCGLTVGSQKLKTRSIEVLRYYFSIDKKLQPLINVIELWMNYYKLNEVGLMTSYTLQLLVLFYLQQNYKIPSVFDLQKNTSPVMIDGWNCAIVATNITNLKLQKTTLLELVQGFFLFYSKFDYVSCVISPFCGCKIEKTKFLKPVDLPESFENSKKNIDQISLNLGLCVQDLFELSRNVVAPQPLETFSKFTSFCRRTLQLIEQSGEQFLCDLFLKGVRDLNQSCKYEVEKPENSDVEQWKEETKNLILKIMKEILAYECTLTSEEGKYECVAKYDVLLNRLSVPKDVSSGSCDFDKEVATTSYVIKEFSRKIESVVCMKIDFKGSHRMMISFSSKSKKVDLNFTDFFYTRLLKFLPENDKIDDENAADDNVDIYDMESISSNSDKNLDKEDVPSDFFDDFSDDLFLDGLGIVDVDNPKEKTKRKPKSRDSTSKEHKSIKRHKRSKSRSPIRRKRSRSRRSLSRTRRSRSRRRSLSRTRRSRSRRRSLSRTRFRRSRSGSSSDLRDRIRKIRRNRKSEERMKTRRNHSRSRSKEEKTKSTSRSRNSLSPSRDEEFKKRQSMLEEIRVRLNEIGTPVMPVVYHQPVVVPVAPVTVPVAPVPPVLHPNPPMEKYDENFFIGNQFSSHKAPKPESGYNEEYISKLYEDKKISLSDYLTIRAKHEVKAVKTVDQLLLKCQVIRQCEEAIKVMTHAKFGLVSTKLTSVTKYKSPLLRTSGKFKFTNPLLSMSEWHPSSKALYEILQKIGIFKEDNNVRKLIDSVAEEISSGKKIDNEMRAKIFQISLLGPLAVNETKKKMEVGTQCKEKKSVEVQVDDVKKR